jgi:hypothetical protein
MARDMPVATQEAAAAPSLYWAYFIRLDILGDPVLAWTGWGDYSFSGTSDPALNGQTFKGITHLVGEVSAVTDGADGSQAVVLTLPGVNLEDEAMRQVVYNRATWQRRSSWVWLAFLDANGDVIGLPTRLKTGRMDLMTVEESEDGQTGTVKCQIEAAQTYAGESLDSRYIEQPDLDPTDGSQKFVAMLANASPVIGQAAGSTTSAGQASLRPGLTSGGKKANLL